MKIIYKWENCTVFNNDPGDYYFVECSYKEISEELLRLMSDEDKEMIKSNYYRLRNNDWVQKNPKLGDLDRAYFLISEKLESAYLEEVSFPYSSLWNGLCPLKRLEGIYISYIEELRKIKVE